MVLPRMIQTFMFMDFGCVRGNTNNLTYVSLLAAPRILYLDPDIEKPTDTLTLNLSPNGFNLNTYNAINSFINQQQKPVCLVSHNGNKFDFPILKQELQKLKVSLSDDVLCADSIYAYYDLLEHPEQFQRNAVIIYEGAVEPGALYTLGGFYDQVVAYPPVSSQPAETNNIMNFRISHTLAGGFLAWTHQIQREFADVQPEELV